MTGVASAVPPNECINDIDCNTVSTACGSKVCSWTAAANHTCVDASLGNTDGWCGSDTDCKCKTQGATCQASVGSPHCTFTKIGPDMAQPIPDMAGADFAVSPSADMSVQPPAPDMAHATSSPDLAVSATCDHDTECPNTACGGEVCRWTASSHQCVAAGTDSPGSDGWCNSDSECKCKGEGATCNLTTLHCTATLPKAAGKSGCEMSQVATPTGAMLALGLVAFALFLRRRARP